MPLSGTIFFNISNLRQDFRWWDIQQGHPVLNPVYLAKSKHGVFYLRWPIPRDLHPSQRASTLKLSLRTRDPKKALRLSRPMIQIGELVNDQGIRQKMRYDEVRAILTQHFRKLLSQNKEKIDSTGRLSAIDRHTLETSIGTANEAIAKDLPLNFLTEPNDNRSIKAITEQFSIDIKEGTVEHDWFKKELKISYRDYCKAVLNYDQALDSFNLCEALDRGAAKPPAEAGISLRSLAERYVNEKRAGANWVKRTFLEKDDHLKLLYEILGAETDVRTVSVMSATNVKDVLQKYPSNRFKKPATKDKSLSEILTMTSVQKIKVLTINKYLQTYNDLFEWGRRNGFVETNHFSGISIRLNKQRSQVVRKPFSAEHVRLLLGTITENRDGLIRKDYQKWGPLIGLYTGARLNEIAQIDLADIREESGILVFDLNDEGEGKQLKSAASRRLVPVHSRLTELGLLAHVEKLRRKGATKLFPDFPDSVEHGRGRNLGRWFNEKLLPKLGIKSEELVFHSLRHTVITALMQADVPEPIVKAIAGHQQEGVTQQHYFKQGYTIQQLNNAMQKLHYEA